MAEREREAVVARVNFVRARPWEAVEQNKCAHCT